ncbi:hypothetical protein CEXT_768001 [Caerostris extrusa]|uniref:Uncharacterized protein n=1 Tax=Caerostris extrusa TaxID=172846 RepID=A0AAV4WCF5_CAEEX|nr:hypothetical protein CEXT_768001 [Caerostris extrusa]
MCPHPNKIQPAPFHQKHGTFNTTSSVLKQNIPSWQNENSTLFMINSPNSLGKSPPSLPHSFSIEEGKKMCVRRLVRHRERVYEEYRLIGKRIICILIVERPRDSFLQE